MKDDEKEWPTLEGGVGVASLPPQAPPPPPSTTEPPNPPYIADQVKFRKVMANVQFIKDAVEQHYLNNEENNKKLSFKQVLTTKPVKTAAVSVNEPPSTTVPIEVGIANKSIPTTTTTTTTNSMVQLQQAKVVESTVENESEVTIVKKEKRRRKRSKSKPIRREKSAGGEVVPNDAANSAREEEFKLAQEDFPDLGGGSGVGKQVVVRKSAVVSVTGRPISGDDTGNFFLSIFIIF